MGSGGAGLPSGGGRQGEEPMGPAGWGQAPVALHRGLSGLVLWGWCGRDGGVFLSSETSFWEKLPCTKWCRFGCALDGDWLEGATDPTPSDGGDNIILRK